MAAIRNRVHGAPDRNDQYIQEDELFNVSTNTIEHELDEVVAGPVEIQKNPHPGEEVNNEEVEEKEDIELRKCFVDFCKQTILHGWHYLVEYEDSSDSGSDTSDIASHPKPSPKEYPFEKRGHHPNQCSCHHVQSTHSTRQRHIRHSTTNNKKSARKTYYANQN